MGDGRWRHLLGARLTVQVAGAGACFSIAFGGVVAALTGWSYARVSVTVRSRGGAAALLGRAFGRWAVA